MYYNRETIFNRIGYRRYRPNCVEDIVRSLYKKRFFAFIIISLVADTFAGVVVKGFEICKNFFARVFSPRFLFRFRKNPLHTVVRIYTGRRNELVYKNLYRIARNQVGEFRHMESNFSYGGKKN